MNALPGTPAHRAARPVDEAPKAGPDRRSPFARDRGRVLHSAALRRLAGKTQVVGPDEDAEVTGVPRTRLTHSLEVAQIGRGMAEDLGGPSSGPDPDVVDTAGLAHDIGHPPFGHNGERALHAVAADCGGFEGNAQTLRILTRLEPKVLDDDQDPSGSCRGLNLTRAVLDACLKYPWARRVGSRKFGVYADDVPVFSWIREGAPPDRRCLEAQIMDWADDVAYSVHDLEDGILAGRIVLGWLARPAERAELAALAAESFSSAPAAELEAAAEALAAFPAVRAAAAHGPHDGSMAATAALKRLTSELVGRFVAGTVEATRGALGDRVPSGHGADLVVPAPIGAEVAVLKAAALRWVMRDPARLAVQARQRDLVTELVERLHAGAPRALDPVFVPAWEAAQDDASRLRVVVDQVAVLTDAGAERWCARLRATPAVGGGEVLRGSTVRTRA
ncbi:deoxyguanosinetriphosphate triphosphohydrolase [Actinomycetospora cinnamomea]|uniref:Deoxyguanosinetriphosphate triphosphohydrolase-like protein n=1 Tax=Actinomycetospora cinnamomea TaxID=663609 RepID=A0A2U1F0U7_9PSEU|nr:deoxyguanosinetriphosphate triphosphohydrolase [Actinomycetospora cinnamomea]PVZ05796.1 dGTPase [Actinomycetospora cinnamomea]